MKLCECGCGNPVPIAKRTRGVLGHVKGKPIRFLVGHSSRLRKRGADHPNWKGGVSYDSNGYILELNPNHHRSMPNGYVRKHILIAEKALGKPLPDSAVVHHDDGDPSNNDNSNLVVCENNGYHLFLHRRKNAFNSCGNANGVKCRHCQKYDDPKNMYVTPVRHSGYHRECYNKYKRERLKAGWKEDT